MTHRQLNVIAAEIRADWVDPKTGKSKVWFGAVPYLDAMSMLHTITEDYGCDPASDIVRYFLSNATHWRGETARKIKAELKGML